jgi:adenine-specific DNA-methyltransferase
MRSALVDYFRDRGRIMIATEAGAEGINLQFCALVVNYDLPWNPQRIEQRIGRCHRYGQRHDVVVVNFLNRKNEADRRVFELLSEKFRLFEGVFGVSDEVLGAIESGIDFEKRIAAIYQRCRKPEEIQAAFDQLQHEIGAEIDEAMTRTRRQLLEHFDDEVREKLRVRDADSRAFLNRFERMLMDLTRHELDGCAEFLTDSSFRLHTCPFAADVPGGLYELPRRSGEAHLYRLNHPLAEAIVGRAKSRDLGPCEIWFDYGAHEGKVSVLEPFVGTAGWLSLSALTVEALDQVEEHMLFAAVTAQGQPLDEEVCRRLFTLPGRVEAAPAGARPPALDSLVRERQSAIERAISERNARFFDAEAAKLDAWADDMKAGLEREIKDLDRRIREARRTATAAGTLEEKLAGQKQVRALESERNQKRRSLFDAQDDLERRRDELIASVEAKLRRALDLRELFAIEWRLS